MIHNVLIFYYFCTSGNKKLLPVFVGSGPPSKRARREDALMEQSEESIVSEGFVMYKGSLLDVEKLVSQLQRSEKARLDTEERLMELQHELCVVNEKSTKQANNIKVLSEDLKIYKDKLRNTDEKLRKVSVSVSLFNLFSSFFFCSYNVIFQKYTYMMFFLCSLNVIHT